MLVRNVLTAVGLALCGALTAFAEEPQKAPSQPPQSVAVRDPASKDPAPEARTFPFRVVILYNQATTPPDAVSKLVEGASMTIKTKSRRTSSNARIASSSPSPTPATNPSWQNLPIEDFLRGVFGSQITPAPRDSNQSARSAEKQDTRRPTPQVRTVGDLFRYSPVQGVAGFTVTPTAKESSGCPFPCFRVWIFCVCIYPDPDPLLDILKDLVGLRVTTPTVVIAVGLTPENVNAARSVLKRVLTEEHVWGDDGCIPLPF